MSRTLSAQLYQLHLAFVRKVNDMHIFMRQAVPVLEEAKGRYAKSRKKSDTKYYVPAIGKTKYAERTDKELKAIYERYLHRSLYETFIVSSVSHFEVLLAEVLRHVIREFPQKLAVSVQGVPSCKDAPVELVTTAATLPEAVERIIEHHLGAVFYASPKAYLQYFEKVTGVPVDDPVFGKYLEIKASRDLIIHNGGRVNRVYLQKAGDSARAAQGAELPIDAAYFDEVIAVLKRISGVVSREVERIFGPRKGKAE